MDGTAAISNNLEALKRILAGLLAMAGLGCLSSPLAGEDGSARRGKAEPLTEPGEGSDCRPTLPRHLRLAILRLLRPAESAARRLIVAAARGLIVALPPQRKSAPKLASVEPILRHLGIAVVMSPDDLARAAAAVRAAALRSASPRKLSLPLFDPPRPSFRARHRTVPAHAAPRILFPSVAGAIPGKVETGFPSGIAAKTTPFSLPPPPSPDDPIDATRLNLRLAALATALDDLPGQAKRFARWRARHDNDTRKSPAPSRIRRISPLRSGRPPGGRLTRFDPSARLSRNIRDVDEVLAHAHALPSTRWRTPTRHETACSRLAKHSTEHNGQTG